MPEVLSASAVVVEIADRHDAKRPNRRQRTHFRRAQMVIVAMHVDPLALETPREIHVAREHVTRIDRLRISRVGRITVESE